MLPVAGEPASKSKPGDEILAQFLEQSRERKAVQRDVSMKVDIKAKLPNLEKTGVMQALRKVSALGKITYKVLGFEGDNMIKKDVIARYIKAEMESAELDARDEMAINSDNYNFEYWGRYGSGDWTLHLFELKPKKKRVGLYAGWLWIHAPTGLPVRESGRLVKSPSVFLKRIEFRRDYTVRDGVALLTRIESEIQTRVVGPAEIEIEFRDYSFDEDSTQFALTDRGTQGLSQ